MSQHLAARTGFRLLINHLTSPVGDALFPRVDGAHPPEYYELLTALRLEVVRAAARAQVPLITTMAYSGAVDDPMVNTLVEIIEYHGGDVHFVQLDAPDEVLAARAGNESRRHWGKPSDPEQIFRILATRDVRASVPYDRVLRLDTSVFSAISAAEVIARWIARGPRPRLSVVQHSGEYDVH